MLRNQATAHEPQTHKCAALAAATSPWRRAFFGFFFQAEDGIRDKLVTGVQTCALPISLKILTDRKPNLPAPLHPQVPIMLRPMRVISSTVHGITPNIFSLFCGLNRVIVVYLGFFAPHRLTHLLAPLGQFAVTGEMVVAPVEHLAAE